jgi:tight adherence protein B
MSARDAAIVAAALAIVSMATRSPRPVRRPGTASSDPRRRGRPTTGSIAGLGSILGHLRRRSARRRTVSATDAAEWADAIARRLRSGETLRSSLADAPVAPSVELATRPLRLAIERGRSDRDAIDVAIEHLGPSGQISLRMLLVSLGVVAEVGGPATLATDRVAAALRLRAADEEDRAAQSAQARLSARVLTAVPVGMLLLLVVADRRVVAAIASPLGATCIAVGVTLNLLGAWWMHRLVRGDAQ